jgi:hypothetical protein
MKIDTLAHVKNQMSTVIDQLGEDYLFRNSPRFWRLIESRKIRAKEGATLPFAASRYGQDEPQAAKGMAIRERASGYKPRKRT